MATISPSAGNLGIKTDRNNLLTYSITGTMGTITEKINGTVVNTRSNPTSGQQFTVSLTQEQWDAIKYGKYNYTETDLSLSKSPSDWQQGGYSDGNPSNPPAVGTLLYNSSDGQRIRLASFVTVSAGIKYKIGVNTGYEIRVVETDANNVVTFVSSWFTNASYFVAQNNTTKLRFEIRKTPLSSIVPSDITSANPMLYLCHYPPNTLTIEMGSDIWTYTFDKRLASTDDVLSAVKAVQDSQTTYLPAVKALLGSAIRAKGGTVNDTDSWDAMVSAVENMPVAKFAKGSFTAASGATTIINNLTFTPTYVLVKISGAPLSPSNFSFLDNTGVMIDLLNVFYTPTTTTAYNVTRASASQDIVPNGFKHYAYTAGTFNFIAIKE